MANHPSAKKRARSSAVKRKRNRARKTAMKVAIKKLRMNKDAKSASEQLKNLTSLLDKLAKSKIIHKNKAANLKSKLARYVNKLSLATTSSAESSPTNSPAEKESVNP
jgi:small subunit ribosomal protein S20